MFHFSSSSSNKQQPFAPDANPISQLFEISPNQVAKGGRCWRIFNAVNKKSRAEASIFYFEKKHSLKIPSKYVRQSRSSLADLLRWDVSQLQKLSHPGLLRVLHPLQENSDSIAFATEPVMGTIGSLLGHSENGVCRTNSTDHHQSLEHKFEELEIKCGLLQVAEAIGFLHCSAQILHGDVSTDNVYVTKYGAWRLGGFCFSQRHLDGTQKFPWYPWSPKLSSSLQPNLHFLAPEYLTKGDITTLADVFSVGCLVTAVFNHGKSPLSCSAASTEEYTKLLAELSTRFDELSKDMPPSLKEAVSKMLSMTLKDRPSIQLFTLAKYFDDSAASCLLQLESIESADTAQKMQFYCSQMKDILYLIPQRLWLSRILPKLEGELTPSKDMSSAIIRPLLHMLEHADADASKLLSPIIKRIILEKQPEQTILYIGLMENANVIGSRLSDRSLRDHMIKLFADGFDTPTQQVQITAVCCLPKLKVYLNSDVIRKTFLFRLVRYFNLVNSSKLQLNVLLTLDALLDILEQDAVVEVIDFLSEINTIDMEVAFSISEIYKHILAETRFNLSCELVAGKMLRSLSSFLGSSKLDTNQLSALFEVVRDLLDYIEYKQRLRLSEEGGDQRCRSPCPVIRFQRHSIATTDPSAARDHQSSQNGKQLRRSSNYLSVSVDVDGYTPMSTPRTPTTMSSSSPQSSCYTSTERRSTIFMTNSVPVLPGGSPVINRSVSERKAYSNLNSPLLNLRRNSAEAAVAGGTNRRPSLSAVGRQRSAEPEATRKSSFTVIGQNLISVFSWNYNSKLPPAKNMATNI